MESGAHQHRLGPLPWSHLHFTGVVASVSGYPSPVSLQLLVWRADCLWPGFSPFRSLSFIVPRRQALSLRHLSVFISQKPCYGCWLSILESLSAKILSLPVPLGPKGLR